MVPFQGLIGPSYQLANKYAAIERTFNWMITVNESSEEPTAKMSFDPMPCNAPFSQLPVPSPYNQPVRGMIELRGNVFGVSGNVCWYIRNDGVFFEMGPVDNDGLPVSMCSTGTGQIFICSASKGYVIPAGGTAGSLFSLASTPGFLGASYATFQDGYIIVVTPGTNQIQISGTAAIPIGDAEQWDASFISVLAGQSDLLSAVISSREYLRVLGNRRSQVFFNTGIAPFVFQSYNETFIETGIAARYSLVATGDSLIWIGQDDRGIRACWRDSAFSPQRISTFAVEQFWQSYYRISDAVAFAYLWEGHLFYQITFPSANITSTGTFMGATWVYDFTVSQILQKNIWTERTFKALNGNTTQRPEMFHCYGYDKHLIGSTGQDGNPGAIYQYSNSVFTDCASPDGTTQVQQPMVPRRVCPHITDGRNRIIINRMRLDCRQAVGSLSGSVPLIYMRISRDGGNTYGTEYNAPLGPSGDYSQLTYFNRLGYSRDFVFDIYGGDNCYTGIVAGYLDEQELSS